jgi:DNA-directed RNA polymerase specialized sigma24 family protein
MTCFENFLAKEYDTLKRYGDRLVGEAWGQDLLHDMSITFLKKGDKLDKLCTRKEMLPYMKRAMRIASWHEHGKFYKQYKEYEKRKANLDVEQVLIKEHEVIELEKQQLGTVFTLLEEINWFDREIFKAYFLHSHTLQTLSDATGINRQTIYRSIRKAQAHIKAKTKEI